MATYSSHHLNFLGNSTHHDMSASEMRYTYVGILTYAVVARCCMDAADRGKTYFPRREIP